MKRPRASQSVVEYFIMMVVVLSAIVFLNFANKDGRMIGAFKTYFNDTVKQME